MVRDIKYYPPSIEIESDMFIIFSASDTNQGVHRHLALPDYAAVPDVD